MTTLSKIRSRLAAAAGLLVALCSAPAAAGAFVDGEFETYDQNVWGANPLAGPPASILSAHFFDVFTSGAAFGSTAPGGHVMEFSGPDAMATFLPQSGAPGVLTSNIADPGSTSAGVFAGQVVALALNIGFEDADYLLHPTGLSFGDLLLTGYTGSLVGLNGRTVRQLNDIANAALGGLPEPFSVVDLNSVLIGANAAFEGGYVSAYADMHYELPAVTAPVPEPPLWLLMLASTAAVASVERRRRRDRRTASLRAAGEGSSTWHVVLCHPLRAKQ